CHLASGGVAGYLLQNGVPIYLSTSFNNVFHGGRELKRFVVTWITVFSIICSLMFFSGMADEASGQLITLPEIFVSGTGTIEYTWFSLPTFVIRSDDGQIYLPSYEINKELQFHGKRIIFAGNIDPEDTPDDNGVLVIKIRILVDEDYYEPKFSRFRFERQSFPIPPGT
ncbi:MAG: hypothetical protein KAX31_06945, partial [Thermoplasmata archaeon]|nr:hypothetical protein [Thermoplasmata archaeon]